MKTVQVIATRPYGQFFPIVSWLIRLIQWSAHSHVILYFPEERKVRHAHFNDVEEIDPDTFFEKNRLVDMKTIYLTDEQYKKVDEFSASKLSKQTGYWATLFGSLVPEICRTLFKMQLKNPFYKGLTCSEYVRACLRQANEVLVFVLTASIAEGTFNTEDAIELAADFPKL